MVNVGCLAYASSELPVVSIVAGCCATFVLQQPVG